ncbi:MAG: CocE/NonD family hydrolase [Bacteroidales bacterium]|nr:CocE/NonD family hydrolase [Bacteroidales bacterium]
MKKFVFLIILNALYLSLAAQNADSIWIVNNYTKMERMITMRDGIKLFTSIYIPKDNSEDHPVLMVRTPYSCAPYGEDQWKNYWNNYLKAYFREGYIMVTQDVRGRWMSEGDFVDVRPFIGDKKTNSDIDESSDTYDAIEWLVSNIPHNNGRVGVFGISYPGFYSTMAAASNHPALVAVSPQAPVTNWFIGDDFHHNGAFFILDAFSFYPAMGGGFGLPHPHPTVLRPQTVDVPVHDNYQFFLETGPLSAFAALAGDSVHFWKDLYEHPDYDSWWKSRDARNATMNLNPAMLWVGGLFDAEDNWGAWNSYKAAETNNPGKEFNKLVMGPWYHNQWANNDGTHLGNVTFGSNTSLWYQQNMEIPFFNYFLKGKGDISKIAEANIFITGKNTWRQFDQWPPAGKEDKVIYLHDNGKLNWDRPGREAGFSEYLSDPAKPVPYTDGVHFSRTREYMTDDQRFAGRRPDVIAFKTAILDEDVTLTGIVTADLLTAVSSTDADFVVKLIDVFPDSLSYNIEDIYADEDLAAIYPMGGYQMLVHGEVFRGRYRNSFENPEPFVPGKIEHVKFDIGDVAHTFQKGHRIMVQVQSSWFPLVDRNPQQFVNIYEAKESDFQKATIRIYHNEENASNIILPVLKK